MKTAKYWEETDQRKRQTKMYQIIPEKKDSEFSRLYPKPQKMPPSKEGTRDRSSSNCVQDPTIPDNYYFFFLIPTILIPRKSQSTIPLTL